MGIESIRTTLQVAKYAGIIKKPDALWQSIEKGLLFGESLELRAKESLLLNTEIDYPPDFDFETAKYLVTGKYFPLILGSHKSHPGAFGPLNVARKLQGLTSPELELNGSLLLVAENIDGGQNREITKNFHAVQPVLDKLNTITLGIFRQKDIKKLLKGGVKKEEIKKKQNEQEKVVKKAIEEKRVLVSLPEGSVESGRQKENGYEGEINGMITLQQNSIQSLVNIIRELGYEPLIFFVGNTGENRIYNPITKKVTEEARKTGIKRALPGGRLFTKSILKSVVDYPTPYKDIEMALIESGNKRKSDPEQYCGERLAQLIPLNERGVYREPTLLSKVRGIKTRIKEIGIFEKKAA